MIELGTWGMFSLYVIYQGDALALYLHRVYHKRPSLAMRPEAGTE
jgi:hypothetical protein